MGTSEIYRAVLALDEVVDALVVDLPLRRHGRLHAALRRSPAGARSSPTSSSAAIRARVRDDCSPRHVPDAVHAVADVPRTLSGKVLELPVKRILMGARPDDVASRDSLANPVALDWFEANAGAVVPGDSGTRGHVSVC